MFDFVCLSLMSCKQMPFLLSARNGFSNTSQRDQSQRPAPPGKISAEEPSHRGNAGSKLVLGIAVFGGALLAAYQTGYIDQFFQKGEQSSAKSTTFDSIKAPEELKQSVHEEALLSDEKTSTAMPNADIVEDKDRNEHLKVLKDITEDVVKEKAPEEGRIPVEVNESAQIAHETLEPAAEQTMDPQIASDDSLIVNNKDSVKQNEMTESESSTEQNDRIDSSTHVSEETGITNASHEGMTIETPKV